MQYAADFVALELHRADVERAGHELGLRRDAEARSGNDVSASDVQATARRHRMPRRTLRLALR